MINQQEVRVRFAPSPTGHLHIGGARVAIFNWLFAKTAGGKFLIRIEDTDKARSTKEYLDSIVSSMNWLQMPSDEPLVIQSENENYHKKVAFDLIEKGLAYKCFCSTDELSALRESSEPGFLYPRTCLNKSTSDDSNKPFVIRFKLPETLNALLSFEDLIKGKVEVESKIFDDFVILKSDFVPTYNFAVVLDDISMKISHVLRGEDHVINTFRQILLYKALGANEPKFGHFPMILGSNGERLSKRHGATSVVDYKKIGFLPQAMLNYLVRLGWSHKDQEVFSVQELINLFSLDQIGLKNAIFDIEKLKWLNSVYIKQLSFKEFCHFLNEANPELSAQYLNSNQTTEQLFELFKSRHNSIIDLGIEIIRILKYWNEFDPSSQIALMEEAETSLLKYFVEQALNQEKPILAADLNNLAKKITAEKALNISSLAQPLRKALIQTEQGASAFALAEIAGKDKLQKIFEKIVLKD